MSSWAGIDFSSGTDGRQHAIVGEAGNTMWSWDSEGCVQCGHGHRPHGTVKGCLSRSDETGAVLRDICYHPRAGALDEATT